MQAVGGQVFVALSIPLFTITAICIYYRKQIRKYVGFQLSNDVRMEQNQDQRDRREHLNDHVCSICLNQPKVMEVSSTCGHSFCAQCILDLYRHDQEQVKCPLCREGISLLFKLFESTDETKEIERRLREYNMRFDDNRPLLRRLQQFPYVLRRLWKNFFRVQFLVYFLRNLRILRLVFVILFYVILPLDIIPEKFLGIIGFIDDMFFILFIIVFFMTIAALQHYRNNH